MSSYVIIITCSSKVNIERALRADGRNSGHFVQVFGSNFYSIELLLTIDLVCTFVVNFCL